MIYVLRSVSRNFFGTAKQVSICFLMVLSMFLSLSCKSPGSESVETRPLAVNTINIKRGNVKDTINYVGTIHSEIEIKILARVSGQIEELAVLEGETATQGDVLAKITAPEMGARVSRMQADVVRAKEESRFLCDQSLLDQKLVKSGSIRKTSADASLQKCESSKAGLKAAKAGLNEITSLAVNIKEVAPFDGKVLLWLTESGENIMPGKPILSFGNKSLEVRVQVHEKDIAAGIQKGTGVIMTLASGKVIRADVRMVASMALGPGRMVEVKIPLQQKDAVNLQHGGSIDVDFILDEKAEILMVPVNAVANKGDVYGLFVEQDNKVKWVVVTPFIVENGWIAVEGNIKEGTRVVVGNLDVMQDGAWVYPVMIKED